MDELWVAWVSYGLCECMKGRCGLHVVWPWGVCRLPMVYVCVMREVRATCGGHGVRVDYLLVVCVL